MQSPFLQESVVLREVSLHVSISAEMQSPFLLDYDAPTQRYLQSFNLSRDAKPLFTTTF